MCQEVCERGSQALKIARAFLGRGQGLLDIAFGHLSLGRAHVGLTLTTGTSLDLVVLGGPHFSLAEFQTLAPLLRGKRRQKRREKSGRPHSSSTPASIALFF